MTSITIPISDGTFAELQTRAEQLVLTPEEYLRRQVEQLMEWPPAASFSAAAAHVLEKNAEPYRQSS